MNGFIKLPNSNQQVMLNINSIKTFWLGSSNNVKFRIGDTTTLEATFPSGEEAQEFYNSVAELVTIIL